MSTTTPPVRNSHGLWLSWAPLLAGISCALAWHLGNEPLWLDETYSYAMTQHGFLDILRLTCGDVHPPLYYLSLKLATLLLGFSPAALRVPSVIAALGLVALGIGPVRRIWGHRTAFVYAALVTLSPGILCFAQEARMYSLAAFLVTGAVLYGHLSVIETRPLDRVWFAVFTWGAAMTQYFALVAAAVNGLIVLTLALFTARERLKSLATAALFAVLAYIPWMMPFWHQIASVAHGFWIPPLSGTLLTFGLVAPFSYKFEDVPYPWQALGAIALGAVIILLSVTIRAWRTPRGSVLAQLHLLGVYALTLCLGLAFSATVQPIFMPRYMMVCAGLLLLAMAVSISRPSRMVYSALLASIVIALGLPAWLRIQSSTFNGPFKQLAQHIRDSNDPEPLLLHNDGQAYYPSWHAVSHGRHVMVRAKNASFEPTGGGIYDGQRLLTTDDLATLLGGATRVWLVDAEPSGVHVDPAKIVQQPGWHQVGPTTRLEYPMSWVKLNLTRFEKTRQQ